MVPPSQRFIIQIDADDGVCAKRFGFHLQLFQRRGAGIAQRAFIRTGTSADDVADACEQILEDVRADNHFAGHNAQIVLDGTAFDHTRGRNQHRTSP